MLLIWYALIKLFLKRTLMVPVYVLSVDDELRDLEHTIKANSYLGFEFSSFLKPNQEELLGLRSNSVIIVPETLGGDSEVWKWLYELRNQGVRVINHKRFYEEVNSSVYLPTLNELWFLENVVYKDNGFYKLIKRLIDIFFGLIGFVVFVITYPFIAVIIKLNSKGPVFFKQPRVGQHGKPFDLMKYRTMKSGSATNIWTTDGDVRIAGFVGKMLRKLRLDELPQSINILKGEMSLVGPRPEQVHIVENLKQQIPFYNERHSAKPGLTGWAQLFVYAGTVEESKRKLEYDLYYIKHRSLWFDFEIILKTVNSVLTGSGK
jgi:lipopolysaccharide/colanic/teichoic acid biosynthesis glycosyltransferase